MSKNKSKDWHQFKKENESHEEQTADEFNEAEQEPSSSSSEAALEHPSYLALEEKLTLAEQKAHENWEKAVRAVAEVENIRRRTQRDIDHAHRYGQEKLINSLIPVIDSLEQALQLAEKSEDAGMCEGLQLTLKLFLDALNKSEVRQLDPLGEAFNPQEHEAMSMQDIPDAKPNTVVAVFQKGYKLNDRIIRPARVIVAKSQAS